MVSRAWPTAMVRRSLTFFWSIVRRTLVPSGVVSVAGFSHGKSLFSESLKSFSCSLAGRITSMSHLPVLATLVNPTFFARRASLICSTYVSAAFSTASFASTSSTRWIPPWRSRPRWILSGRIAVNPGRRVEVKVGMRQKIPAIRIIETVSARIPKLFNYVLQPTGTVFIRSRIRKYPAGKISGSGEYFIRSGFFGRFFFRGRFALRDKPADRAPVDFYADSIGNLDGENVFIETGYLATQSAGGENCVALLKVCQHLLLFFLPLLLRANQQKIKDRKHCDHEKHRIAKVQHSGQPACAPRVLCERIGSICQSSKNHRFPPEFEYFEAAASIPCPYFNLKLKLEIKRYSRMNVN